MSEERTGSIKRTEFPILQKKLYLASHSMGAVPNASNAALQQYFTDWAELGIEAWDGPFWQSIVDFQELVGGLLGLPGSSVCPTGNVTRGMAGIASCLNFKGKRNRILISELEFTTTFPFWQGQVELGAEIVVIPSDDGVHVSLENFQRELDDRTLLVICSHAWFRSGALCPDLRLFTDAIHHVGGMLMLDVYQTLGAVPLPAAELNIDIIVGGCHKWLCGGPGGGFLAVHPDRIQELEPRLTGWMGLANPFEYTKDSGRGTPHPTALRFLGGTPSVPALYAARPALEMIRDIGIQEIRRTSQTLTECLRESLLESGFQLRSPADANQRNGMLCIEVDDGHEVVAALAKKHVVVDYRPDCGLRVSPHFYNSKEELVEFARLLGETTGNKQSSN